MVDGFSSNLGLCTLWDQRIVVKFWRVKARNRVKISACAAHDTVAEVCALPSAVLFIGEIGAIVVTFSALTQPTDAL